MRLVTQLASGTNIRDLTEDNMSLLSGTTLRKVISLLVTLILFKTTFDFSFLYIYPLECCFQSHVWDTKTCYGFPCSRVFLFHAICSDLLGNCSPNLKFFRRLCLLYCHVIFYKKTITNRLENELSRQNTEPGFMSKASREKKSLCPITMLATFHNNTHNKELKQRRRRCQRERQKSIRFTCILTKQQLYTCSKLFCTFLSRRCTTSTWNFLIFTRPRYGVGKYNTKIFLFFSKLSYSIPEHFTNIWQIGLKWIRSMKFETVRNHFQSDVCGLLSSRNFATCMVTWRIDFSSLLSRKLSTVRNTYYEYFFQIYTARKYCIPWETKEFIKPNRETNWDPTPSFGEDFR